MRTAAFVVLCAFCSAVGTAQTPLAPEFLLATPGEVVDLVQFGATIACDQLSVCALVWTSATPANGLNHSRQWLRMLSPAGQLSPRQLLRADEGIGPRTPIVALDPGFALFSETVLLQGEIVSNFRLYDKEFRALGPIVNQPFRGPPVYGDPDSFSGSGPTVVTPLGFVTLSAAFDEPFDPTQCAVRAHDDCFWGTYLYFFDREGHKVRERVRVNESTSGAEYPGGFAIDGQGNIAVAFSRYTRVGTEVYVRRFTFAGDPLGPETQVSHDPQSIDYQSTVAASPDGEILVAWLALPADLSSEFGRVFAQRFGANGVPLGPVFRVSSAEPAHTDPLLTADRHGNYFATWSSIETGNFDLHARLFRHDGAPVTRDESVVNQGLAYDQGGGLSSFAPNGTLTVSYGTTDPALAGAEESVPLVRRYSASVGPEVCAIAGSKVRCDLGRTGGFSELQLTWGGRRGEVTLFGDVDGDGREDVCSYLDAELSCDVSHEGKAPFWRERFGFPGDVVLLGDVDGDRRAEPCVWRKGSVLICDTRHDGTESFRTQVGRLRGTPLLGDMDGDGKADLCVVDGPFWSCLLSATGELDHITFGRASAAPALGDANLDGKADPCALRKGRLTCDTRHRGGSPDFSLQLDVAAGARLLFGNLDGL